MSAPADGHTLLFTPGSMLAAPLQARPPAFDWLSEFAPIGKAGRLSFCLAVHPDLPVRTVADLVAYARANPDKLSFSTATLSELMAASQFMKATDTRMVRVPYKGGTQAMPDLLAGRVQVMFGPVSLVLPHAKSGAVRVLATLLPQRSAALPDVPTMAEAGVAAVSVHLAIGLRPGQDPASRRGPSGERTCRRHVQTRSPGRTRTPGDAPGNRLAAGAGDHRRPGSGGLGPADCRIQAGRAVSMRVLFCRRAASGICGVLPLAMAFRQAGHRVAEPVRPMRCCRRSTTCSRRHRDSGARGSIGSVGQAAS
jgi:hypothetical protein